MSDPTSMSEAISEAAAEYLSAQESKGMVTGFFAVVAYSDIEGVSRLMVCSPEAQEFPTTLGLLEFGKEWVKDDLRRLMESIGTDE